MRLSDELTLDELRLALQYIPADSRETWVAVGMGIKAQFGEDGWELWNGWSQSGTGYDLRSAQQVWRSFRSAGVGIASVIKLATDAGWRREQRSLSAEDRRRLATEHEARRRAREAQTLADEAREQAMREAVASACTTLWADYCTEQGSSEYLARKQVAALGVRFMRCTVVLEIDDQAQRCQLWPGEQARQYLQTLPRPRPAHLSMLVLRRGDLVLPLRDEAGRLWAVQQISATGKKLFPKFGRKSGCFHALGALDGAPVIGLAEGYATAASCQMATGWPMVAGLDAGNLGRVAAALRVQYPDARLVVCGDDDPATPGNPGRSKAQTAAQAVAGVAVFPPARDGKDWNDQHHAVGLDALRAQLLEAAGLALPPTPSEGDRPASAPAAPPASDGGAGAALTLPALLRRYALVEGTTHVWDLDTHKKMRRAGFEAHVGRELFREWSAVTDPALKMRVDEEWVRDRENGKKINAKKGSALGTPPLERYVYIDGTKDVWDASKKRRVPEGAVKMALGDGYSLWLNSPERRVVDMDHIVFDPTMKKDPAVYINTFEGLPLTPERNDAACENMIWLLRFLCNEDEAAFTWLVRWLAYPLQHMGAKMDTAVLMHSTTEGSGKSFLFADIIGKIYGKYAATVGQVQLESNFNAWQSGKLWAVFEEVVSRDHRYTQTGKIKHLITGKTVRMESKFINGWEETNHMNSVFLSNEIMPWPISDSDRRMLVIWPFETMPEERQKAVGRELESGGAAALYAWLLAVDLGDFDQRTRPPNTAARQRLVALSRTSWQTFLHLWRSGELGEGLWGCCLSSDLYALYTEWCARNKENQMSHTKFGLLISAEFDKTRAIPWTDGNSRRFGVFFLPTEGEARQPASLRAPDLGVHVKAWRAAAKLAGWSVDAWGHLRPQLD